VLCQAIKPESTLLNDSLKSTVLTALFAAAGAAGGYLFMSVPNVEVLTLLMFLAGFALGWGRGLTAAAVAGIIYFGFNPQGMFPPQLVAQILGLSAAPLLGAFFRRLARRWDWRGWTTRSIAAVLGMAATVGYDLLTNLAYPLSVGMTVKATFAVLIAGIPFAALHIASNAAIFFFILPLLISLVRNQTGWTG